MDDHSPSFLPLNFFFFLTFWLVHTALQDAGWEPKFLERDEMDLDARRSTLRMPLSVWFGLDWTGLMVM